MTFLKDKDAIETQYLLVYIARLSFDHVSFELFGDSLFNMHALTKITVHTYCRFDNLPNTCGGKL